VDVKTGTVIWEKNIGKEYRVAGCRFGPPRIRDLADRLPEQAARVSPLINGMKKFLKASMIGLQQFTDHDHRRGRRQLIDGSSIASLDP
jgi:hypothetical protein